MSSVFETLRCIDVSEHIEKKNGLSYVSWAWAWDTLMKLYPTANAEVHEDRNSRPWFDDGNTGWVKVSVTVEGITRTEYLPIMDYRNKSIPAEKITSFDANTSVQRALTKAIARHGLGLYIYAGEDLPPEVDSTVVNDDASQKAQKPLVKKDKNVDEESNKPMSEAQRTKLRQIVQRYGNDALDIVNEFKVAMEIPNGVDLTAMQATMLLSTFLSRGMR